MTVVVLAAGCYMPRSGHCGGDGCEQDANEAIPEPCGSASLLGDDFEDGELGEPWIADWDGGTVSETGGEIAISLAGTPEGGTVRAGLVSWRRTRLRNVRLSVEVREVPAADQLGRFAITVEDATGDAVELAVTAGRLQAARRGDAPLADVPWDPAVHRFWGLREYKGTLTWETSPDGVTWTPLASDPEPLVELSSVRVRLEGSAHAGTSDGGSIRFDNVNGGVARGTWCPIGDLHEAFDEPVIDAGWTTQTNGGCNVTLADGALLVDGTGGYGVCSIRSTSLYDLSSGEIVVAVPQVAGELSSSRLRLQVDPAYWIELATRNGKLVPAKSEGAPIAPEDAQLVPYDPETQLFWRIREASGMLEWATSPDGLAWTPVWMDHYSMPLGRFEVLLGVVAEEGAPASAGLFDGVNDLPGAATSTPRIRRR